MKLSTLALVSLAATSLSVHAASLSLTNLSGADSLVLLDNAGNPLASGGFLALYAFGPGDGSPPADAAAFAANGDNGLLVSLPYDNAINNGFDGGFFAALNFSNPADGTGSGAIGGQNLYLAFGNAPTAADSLQIGLINLGLTPNASDEPPPGWVVGPAPAPLTGTAAIGNLTAGSFTLAGVDHNMGVAAGLVPEPSSSMLFGLAGLALLIRRKR